MREYRISLGSHPIGHKQREGDKRTPEGLYVIDGRNSKSRAYLSLHISYPIPADVLRATAAGQAPGGNIMIHGLANGWGFVGSLHLLWDWTDGCIAVTNDEMREIWSLYRMARQFRSMDERQRAACTDRANRIPRESTSA